MLRSAMSLSLLLALGCDASPVGSARSDGAAALDASNVVDASGSDASGSDASGSDASKPTGTIKFNPGHGFSIFNYNDTLANHLAYIAALNDPTSNNYDPNHYIKHVLLYARWNVLENTQGDYSFGGGTTKGFGLIDQYVNACAAVGRHFMLSPIYQGYGSGPTPNAHSILPAYMDNIANGPYVDTAGTWHTGFAVVAQLDTAAGMARYVALTQAYAARYDGNPNFEMWSAGETSIGVPAGFNGFNYTNWDNLFMTTWMPAARAAFAHTQVRLQNNFPHNGPAVSVTAQNNSIAVGGPDTMFGGDLRTWGDAAYVGDAAYGGVDHRQTMAHVNEQQERRINIAGTTPAAVYNDSVGGQPEMQSHYWIWERQNYGTAMQWTRDIFPFIQSIQGAVNTTRPPGY